MRATFAFDGASDDLLPCAGAGLSFGVGDVLEVVDRTDPNWWQVRQLSLSIRFH